MHLTDQQKHQKLSTLVEIEGYESFEEMAEAIFTDSVSPAICQNAGCNYTCEMEPDQDRGWCEECSANSMASALILAGVI